MAEMETGEELTFSQEEVEKIVMEAIEGSLTNMIYDETKVPFWINQICEKIMENLVELEKPYKYIVNCMIMQRNGAGAYVTASCHWDTVADGAVVYQWPRDKQAKDLQSKSTMQCIATVFAVSMIS